MRGFDGDLIVTERSPHAADWRMLYYSMQEQLIPVSGPQEFSQRLRHQLCAIRKAQKGVVLNARRVSFVFTRAIQIHPA
jgi:hypothetical protein